MTPPALSFAEKYTYADYLQWPDEERWELIEGIPYNMTPAPTRKHQRIIARLTYFIEGFLLEKPCELAVSPFDVQLPKANQSVDESDTIVQPDLAVFCDTSTLTEKGAVGAPDWVIEILSPSTANKDMTVKSILYQAHGVKEYWIVDPQEDKVQVFLLDTERNQFGIPQRYDVEATLSPALFPDLKIALEKVFEG
ncbi:MAG: Uma2 family endonuclease [Bacteroidota bacterium]